MKKIFKISLVVSAILVIFLVWWNLAFNTVETVTYEFESYGNKSKLTLRAKGSVIVSQTEETEVMYKKFGYSNSEEAKEDFGEVYEVLQNKKGVTYSINYKEDRLIEKGTINFEEMSKKDLEELDTFFNNDQNKASFQEVVNDLEQKGAKKVEQ